MPCLRTFVLLLLAAVAPVCRPCSIYNWQPMTLCEQAAEAKIIVYGTVTAHYPIPDFPYDIDSAYIAEMEVRCTLKGEDLPPRINISWAGQLTSCDNTLLPVGGTYITFVKERAGQLVPDEVNYLSVAFEPTEANFRHVERAVEGARGRCPQLDGQTDDGVDGYGPEAQGDCGDGALRVSQATLCVIATAIMAWLIK